VAHAVVRRNPELHHVVWDIAFAPVEIEPWSRYDNWKFTFSEWDLEAENDFWTPLGRWTATANDAPISPANAIEILLDGAVVATLSAPSQAVTFNTPWDTGGNNPRMTARLTGAPLDAAEVSLYYEAQFDLNGQPARFTPMGEQLLVSFPDAWNQPMAGVLSATPQIYDRAGTLLATGDPITLTTSGDGGSQS